MKIVFSENGYRFIWLSITPVVLLHFFFLNYSVHDFTALYASLFFSVLLGILYDKVKKSGAVSVRKMQIGLIFTVMLMVAEYWIMNFRGTNDYQLAGETIKRVASNDEVIFSSKMEIDPQLIYYTQRNVQYAKDETDAREFLKATGKQNGICFFYQDRLSIKRISSDSLSHN